MSSILQNKLNTYIQKHYSSIGEFERKNSLRKNSIRDLISSKSKNPTIETVINIADALDCSLDEIFDREKFISKNLKSKLDVDEIDAKLFCDICVFISNFLERHNIIHISFDEIFKAIKEICRYCREKNKNIFDIKFAEWLLENSLLKNIK